ncbi:putative late blight resistance protein homolog R1B-16 isoform X2 [Lycium barbarum]|uniref:putative late blight resistance protein homolog R1B-16 isoform X2 n=1 Tax=Lycium barbarum TaxID=112863 RepID=UPI00293F4783|nr:putative late blight resistance protein homolog R1B-16 isoform X2 [Lycium barbarum]
MAYASVASLMRTIELLLTSYWSSQSLICDHREEFLRLHEKLEVFLKNFEKSNVSGEMTDLEAKVKEVANDVEYTIQLRLTETVKGQNKSQKRKARRRFRQSLQRIAGDIDRVLKESTKIQDKGKHASKKSLVQDFSSSAKDILNVKNNMVGRDDQRKRLLEDLTRGYSGETKVIPIIGMGGIGKTTLAKEVYNAECIRSRFDVRAWATISQQHNVKEILLSLLRSTKGDSFNMDDEQELADMLQKSLKRRRYLIVLDDMWSDKAWDDVRQCFPIENNESRILLTTRNTKVANSAGTENHSLEMGFMDPDESWNLFGSIAFANEALTSEFESIGKQIVDKCHGLPLTIVVIAGLLSKSEKTIEDWESVAKDVKSFVTNDPDKQCLHLLALSYNHLPNHLKACLLYFGTFPENSEIPVKKLLRLWMAEGFLKPEKDLEGEAEKCVQDFVDRCLVLVSKKSRDESKIKSCKVHDLIHELCLREAKSQNIFVIKDIAYDVRGSYRALLTPGHHHLVRRQTDDEDNNLLNQTRSVFFLSFTIFTLEPTLNHFNLLRILDLSRPLIENFPPEILCLIWLRYLAMYGNFHIPSEICRLWNLQTFIVKSYDWASRNVSETIWELKQLRHLELRTFYLPNPPSVSVGEERDLYFPNIQTISDLSPSSCTKEVISGIQNAKKLEIFGDSDDYKSCKESRLVENLVHLHQLEKLSFSGPLQTIPSAKAFPATLKKLKLEETFLLWEDLNIIGEIPNLEVLKLLDACRGREWHPIADGFTRLKLLLIDDCHLKYWKATNDNFPVLERLLISFCRSLNEIPIEFAEIDSLQLIELDWCEPKLEASAARIQKEQVDLGNKPVDVRISNTRKYINTLEPTLNHFNLLGILDLSCTLIKNFPPEILCLIWLRYLEMYGDFHIPSEICRLWNLQTFIVKSYDSASRNVSETIWELKQLRHLELGTFYLPNPPSVSVGEERHLYFPNIQTISGLSPSSCTKEVISGIRNAKKLEISGDSDDYKSCKESRLLENLVHLHQLETLSFRGPLQIILSAKYIPATLNKLKLRGTKLRWEELNIIGEIPNLEVLKLKWNGCEGGEWHPIAGGFTRLKLLLIDDCDLEDWIAADDNFPVLERLVIKECGYLKEIPIEFAEIDSLQLIELICCETKLNASAERIQQEQEELGNKPVDVRISNPLFACIKKRSQDN